MLHSTGRSDYFRRLDAIRGFAILWVFVFHFCGACFGWESNEWLARFDGSPLWLAWPGKAAAHFCRMGAQGVPVFFVLSGFLIHYTFCRGSNPSVKQFWLRRFGRIYPPYFAALLILALSKNMLWRLRDSGNLVHHALLIHNFRADYFHGVNGSFWSLAVEAQYYLLYPLLLSIRRAVGMPAVLGTALAVKLAINLLLNLGVIPQAGDLRFGLILPERYFEWILGMYVADCLLAGKLAFAVPRGAGWLCFAAALLAFQPGQWIGLAAAPLVALATAIWIDRVVRVPAEPWAIERLLFPLGIVSYSLYLWHQPIVNKVAAAFAGHPGILRALPEPCLWLIALLTAAVASALIGVAAYRWTEVPAMAWTRKLARRLGPPPQNESRTDASPPLKIAA